MPALGSNPVGGSAEIIMDPCMKRKLKLFDKHGMQDMLVLVISKHPV